MHANNRSLISAQFCISAYFLTAETYKRMRLTTRVYGSYFLQDLIEILNIVIKCILRSVYSYVYVICVIYSRSRLNLKFAYRCMYGHCVSLEYNSYIIAIASLFFNFMNEQFHERAK